MNEIVEYTTSAVTAKDALEKGKYDLYDAISIIGKINKCQMPRRYISIIKDGAGVGRVRLLPKNSAFIGTMGALTEKRSDLDFVFSLLTRLDLGETFSGSTIPHIYFKDYGNSRHFIPSMEEQRLIGSFFRKLDDLITLHQRE